MVEVEKRSQESEWQKPVALFSDTGPGARRNVAAEGLLEEQVPTLAFEGGTGLELKLFVRRLKASLAY